MSNEKKFMGNRIVILSALYLCIMNGMMSSWSIPFGAVFPERYGVSFVILSAGTSVMMGMGVVLSFISGSILNRLGTKKCMLIGVGCSLAYPMLMAFSDSLVTYFISMVVLGLMMSIPLHSLAQYTVVQWYHKDSAAKISLCLGMAYVGMFIYQNLMGILLSTFGLQKAFMLLSIPTSVLGLIIMFLVVDKPENVGQKPYGWEESGKTEELSPEEVKANRTRLTKLLYKNPAFYLYLLGVFAGSQVCMQLTNYGTAFFPSLGMELTAASTMTAVLNLATAVVLMFAVGKLVVKQGPKKIQFLVMAAAVLSNILLIALGIGGKINMFLIVLIVVVYAFGSCASSMGAMVTPILFGNEVSTEANTKCIFANSLVSMILSPICAFIMEGFGFNVLWGVMAGAGIISMVFFAAAFRVAKRQDAAA